MKFENTEVFNFEGAIRGMRNPLESWDKSDSQMQIVGNNERERFELRCEIGKNDLELMRKLIKAGTEHRKFLRQIFVSVDITAPLFFWKEFDKYQVGITTNSCSTMHKLADTPITINCFEMDDFENLDIQTFDASFVRGCWCILIEFLEELREGYNRTKDKRYWKELIRLLPESWLQKRTVTMNYENILNMYNQRKNHKLSEWSDDFCKWCLQLPYFKELFTND